jgi:hypothetical protein
MKTEKYLKMLMKTEKYLIMFCIIDILYCYLSRNSCKSCVRVVVILKLKNIIIWTLDASNLPRRKVEESKCPDIDSTKGLEMPIRLELKCPSLDIS